MTREYVHRKGFIKRGFVLRDSAKFNFKGVGNILYCTMTEQLYLLSFFVDLTENMEFKYMNKTHYLSTGNWVF